MTILDEIIGAKRKQVMQDRELRPIKLLERSIHFEAPTVSLRKYLQRSDLFGIIAEIKRKSPSKGILNSHISVEQLSIGYMQAGASALSILTDREFFGGSNADLLEARRYNFCPILRKEFVLDEYQLIEARSIGADVILLISAVLKPEEVRSLSSFAKSLGLEVLLEVHSREELERSLCEEIDLVGVNNRDLRSFEENVETSLEMSDSIPQKFVKVAESGISEAKTVRRLKAAGFAGFLIGEAFMAKTRPDNACASLLKELKTSGS